MLDTYPLMRRDLRRSFVRQVSEIVEKHDILPYSLYCSSLHKEGDNPVARGGFAVRPPNLELYRQARINVAFRIFGKESFTARLLQ